MFTIGSKAFRNKRLNRTIRKDPTIKDKKNIDPILNEFDISMDNTNKTANAGDKLQLIVFLRSSCSSEKSEDAFTFLMYRISGRLSTRQIVNDINSTFKNMM